MHPFDAEFGTDTSGLIAAEELVDSRRRKNIHNTGFYATAPSIFHQAFARLEIDFERFTFVDLGAGKGRIMLLASNFPFQQVLGVEFIPELQAIATRNIAVYQPPTRQCQDVQCILSDVQDFVFPPVPLVIFMWHPFVGPVFERVMQNLEDSLRRDPREVYIVYLKPEFGHVIERIPSLQKLWESRLTMSEQRFRRLHLSRPIRGLRSLRDLNRRSLRFGSPACRGTGAKRSGGTCCSLYEQPMLIPYCADRQKSH